MALNIEEIVRGLRYQDTIATDKPVDFDSTLNVEEAVTLQSTLAVTGAITATGGVTGGVTKIVESVSASDTLLAAESGTMYVDVKGSATTVFTLPAAVAGTTFTFVCGDAAGEILITPVAGDAIVTKIHAAENGTALAPAAGTGIKNTAATNVVGDSITLTALDGTSWYGTSIVGLWASQ